MTPPVGGDSTASGTQALRPTGQRTRTHMHAPDLRGAQQPSQTRAYMLVYAPLSFRGGTKKSHPKQPPRGALMGRPINRVAPL
jgi:hypothetical protein